MTIPEILDIRKPLLEYLAKDQEFHSLDDCVNALANHFQLTDEEKEKKFSGNHPRKIFRKRVTDVVSQFRIGINGVGTGTELIQDETKPGDASFCISELGLKLLEQNNSSYQKLIN